MADSRTRTSARTLPAPGPAAATRARGDRPFDLVVFDFDGTLVDSSRDIALCLHLAFADTGVAVPVAALLKEMGHPLDDVWRTFTGHPPLGDVFQHFCDRYREHHRAHGTATSEVFPGVGETLARLADLRLAIATTKPTYRVLQQARHFGLFGHFQHIQGTDDFAPKPDPAILHRVLAALPADPARVLLVGDTERDVEAGRRAGCATAAITWGARERPYLEGLGAGWVIDRIEEVLRIVDGDR